MEGDWPALETDMTRIQTPTPGNNDAAYNQKTVAGTEMEELAGRKELETHWTRVCDRLRKEIGDIEKKCCASFWACI